MIANRHRSLAGQIKLAWHFFTQEYHYVHQRLLRWIQGTLLLFIVTLSLSSNSIQQYLQQNLQGLLGSDAVISQKQALSQAQFTQLAELTNNIAVSQQITTILTHQENLQKTKLKAVDSAYPLQGELLTSTTKAGIGKVTESGPRVGEIWLDARLMTSLEIEVGQSLVIADTTFTVTRILQHEPDRIMEGYSSAMRAMINSLDMPALNFADDLIQYRYLLAADDKQISQLIDWQKEHLPAAQLLHKQGKHPLALFWQRTENFLGLASIILFFMAAIAIEQLGQVHMRKDQFFSAVCMSLGADKVTGLYISMFKWLFSVITLIPAVLLLAFGCHFLVIEFLNESFPQLIWQLELVQAIKPIGAVLLIFAVFHAPVWLALLNSSVASQFMGQSKKLPQYLSKCASVIVLFIVAFTYSDNALLTFMLLTAVSITVLLMIFISWSSLTLGEKVTQQVSGLVPFTLFMMKQRLVSKSTQILGVGLCAFLLLFTLMLLKDLGNTMTANKRQHDGNLFVSQASKVQMDYLTDWAKENAINIRQSKPYMHAKLLKINGKDLSEYSDKPSGSLATLSERINLHWTDTIPSNNVLASGSWWQANDNNWQQVSIEQEVMTDLGLSLGDTLIFYINKQNYQFTVNASHKYKPGAGSIIFWVQMPPSALAHIQAPLYSMASIELADEQWPLLTPLWQKFPTLRMVSLKEITDLFDRNLAIITKVISGFSLMIILLSAVVIFASTHALQVKEKKKNSVIMSFGFSRKTCLHLNMIEWLVTATISAVGAIAGTYIAGLLIYQSQFSLTYQPDFTWLLATLVVILTTMTCLGVFASRHSLQSSVRELMAEN